MVEDVQSPHSDEIAKAKKADIQSRQLSHCQKSKRMARRHEDMRRAGDGIGRNAEA